MALKDWKKKRSTLLNAVYWTKGNIFIGIDKEGASGRRIGKKKWFVAVGNAQKLILSKNFDTKAKALAFAKAYRRKH